MKAYRYGLLGLLNFGYCVLHIDMYMQVYRYVHVNPGYIGIHIMYIDIPVSAATNASEKPENSTTQPHFSTF